MSLCFVPTHRMYNTKCEPKGKLQTVGDHDVLMKLHPCYKKCTIQGRLCMCGGRNKWGISVPSSQLWCKPKTAPKLQPIRKRHLLKNNINILRISGFQVNFIKCNFIKESLNKTEEYLFFSYVNCSDTEASVNILRLFLRKKRGPINCKFKDRMIWCILLQTNISLKSWASY